MSSGSGKLLCYNSGCGQTYDPEENHEDSCRHHSGVPVFHDAYKGWSCCKKKCTDFTEFLNIKGCSLSYHSNIKPPEPEKPKTEAADVEVIERKPIVNKTVERPPFDTPLVKLKPFISESLKTELSSLKRFNGTNKEEETDGKISIGTQCKNNSCKATYEGPQSDLTSCTYHPGAPVFHEGLKFWTCCTKRTTDFETFLSQIGCKTGDHMWKQKKKLGSTDEVRCRTDWHQTEKYVCFTIFGKKSDPSKSKFEMNAIRLKFSIYFPEQGSYFAKDMELSRVVDVKESKVSMFPAKIEIQIRKKEPGSWMKMEIIRQERNNENENDGESETDLNSQIESVDLSCI